MALALLDHGYDVTLMTNRDSAAIARGCVMSSQCMFQSALQIERDLGLSWWDDTCPPIEGVGLAVPHPERAGAKAIDWTAELDQPALSVDQRLKMAAWLEEAQRRGVHLVLREAAVADLEELAASHDLVLVGAGKGEIVNLFPRDAQRSSFSEPQRSLALTYVHGLESTQFSRVAFNLIPELGEYFVFPALTLSDPCHIMVFEGIPGTRMDCWDDVASPQAHLNRSLELLRMYLPWEFARCSKVELTDANGVFAGRLTPTVRHPVATLPSGRHVFAMADAAVINDPITGQGSNSAAKCCHIYLDAILAQRDGPFSVDWMVRTFDGYWQYAKYVVQWTNSMLMPPPPHILALLAAAGESATIAASIANGFDDPRHVFPWWSDPTACERLIAAHRMS